MTHTYIADPEGKKPLPPLTIDGPGINPRDFVEKGTGGAAAGAYVLAILGLLLATAFTFGIALLVYLLSVASVVMLRKRAIAAVRGSAIEVGAHQLPEIHDCASAIGRRLGMAEIPRVYVLEGNTINALAAKLAGRKVVILMDDLVDACLRSGDPRTLTFIIAHEMAHHALGHTGIVRGGIAMGFKNLARLDEFSADAVANAVVGDARISARAITLLAAGPQLMSYIDPEALKVQALAVAQDKNSKSAERPLTHPLLLRRLSRFA